MNNNDLSPFKEERLAMREEAARIHDNIMKRLNRIERTTNRIYDNINSSKEKESLDNKVHHNA